MATILLFSLASLGAATSQTIVQLLFWRALLGIGMGGEWASGAVLISETWPPAHRNKAISIMQSGWAIGYISAALMAALILGAPGAGPDAWRWLFLVGVVPAFFTLWIRRYVDEPDVWHVRAAARVKNPFRVIFGPGLAGRTLLIILLGATVQFAYWGLVHRRREAGHRARREDSVVDARRSHARGAAGDPASARDDVGSAGRQ